MLLIIGHSGRLILYDDMSTGGAASIACGIDESTKLCRKLLDAMAAAEKAAIGHSNSATVGLSQSLNPEWYQPTALEWREQCEKADAMVFTKILEHHRKSASKPGQCAGAAGLDGYPGDLPLGSVQGCKRSPTEHFDRQFGSLLWIGQGAAPTSEGRSKMADLGNVTGGPGEAQARLWGGPVDAMEQLVSAAVLDYALNWEAAQRRTACQSHGDIDEAVVARADGAAGG